jgi:hypothetical protein
MRRGLTAFAFVLVAMLSAMAQQSSGEPAMPTASTAFLPRVGQSTQYKYSDTITSPKGTRRFTATLRLTSVTAERVQASIAINGKEPHSIDFFVDDLDTLQPTSMPDGGRESANKRHNSDQTQQAAAIQAFVSRISLASRIAAQPTQETSFQTKMVIPGASCPLHPTLVLKPTQPEEVVADASDTTSVSASQGNRRLFMPLGLGIGAGFIGGAIGGTPGRIVGISISATSLVVSLVRSRHSGPLPADVSLHIEGKLADGRLQSLSGDQELVVHASKHTHTITDKWSLVAGSEFTAGL